MDSLTHAARIIDGTSQPDGVDALLAELGFTSGSHTLDAALQDRIGLPSSVLSARVGVAEGALRSLAIQIAPDADVREATSLIARQLSMRAPHLLWLLVITRSNSPSLTIATWRCIRSVPRIVAMITERGRVVQSDAETLCALSAANVAAVDTMRHMRWLDILGRDAVTRRFFHALTAAVTTLAQSLPPRVARTDAREIAVLTASRLLFLSFLETKGWLNGDFGFLANGFAECMARGGMYQLRVLEPLFFGTLNTRVAERAPRAREFGRVPFLNGGLFSRTTVERIHRHSRFSDDALGALFDDVLVRYRFTAREDTGTWSQSAIDPEMLGKVFESLMESGHRKRSGVFYTPQRFVERLTTLTLTTTLANTGLSHAQAERLLRDDANVNPDPRLLERVTRLRVLDPACGSGAFLVYALEQLACLRTRLGDTGSQSDVRRSVLAHSIFGVDSNPTAVWLCELRLWLSAVIGTHQPDPMRVTPLPNLDRQIRVGNSLSGDAFTNRVSDPAISRATGMLRDRYTRSTGRRKISLGRRLDLAERTRALGAIESAIVAARSERGEILRAARSRDLFDSRQPLGAKQRDRLAHLRATTRALHQRRSAIARGVIPDFTYPTHFAEVADGGGFDAVIGNPPWVRVHNMPPDDRARYRETFSVFRASAWAEGARGADAGRGFAGQTDIAALFVERSIDLLAHDGTLGFLLPSKLWRSLAGGGARQLILDRTRIVAMEDHSDAPDSFDAAVYPSILVTTRNLRDNNNDGSGQMVRAGVQQQRALRSWNIRLNDLALDSSPGSPWLLLPPEGRASFDRLTRAGVPLFESLFGRPHLGVKTGCNDAFVVRDGPASRGLTSITATERRGEIETILLRPLVRGETLTRWRLAHNDERIIWTHDEAGVPLRELPPHACRWLTHYRGMLERRSDSHSNRWWSLFRVESARSRSPRVIWSDFGRAPRAAVTDHGDPVVPLNTCYSIACPDVDDALALAAILNSQVAAAWLACVAEPARGGYHRYLGWTVARLPIPMDWPRARRLLAPVAESARRGNEPAGDELCDLVLDAYGLHAPMLDPLLGWIRAGTHD